MAAGVLGRLFAMNICEYYLMMYYFVMLFFTYEFEYKSLQILLSFHNANSCVCFLRSNRCLCICFPLYQLHVFSILYFLCYCTIVSILTLVMSKFIFQKYVHTYVSYLNLLVIFNIFRYDLNEQFARTYRCSFASFAKFLSEF